MISQALPALITHPPVIVITLVATFAAEAAPFAAGLMVLGAPRAWDTGHWSLGTALPHAWLQQESHLWVGSALA